MTGNAPTGARILGSLRAHDGTGFVRVEDRLDTRIDDAWSALTDPARLARWYGEFEGEARLGGELRARVFASGWEGAFRVRECEPPRKFTLVSQDPDEPGERVTEVTLTADGEQTILVVEEHGVPMRFLAGYGAGTQIHVEDLVAHLAGRDRCDAEARWHELQPAYDKLAADLG